MKYPKLISMCHHFDFRLVHCVTSSDIETVIKSRIYMARNRIDAVMIGSKWHAFAIYTRVIYKRNRSHAQKAISNRSSNVANLLPKNFPKRLYAGLWEEVTTMIENYQQLREAGNSHSSNSNLHDPKVFVEVMASRFQKIDTDGDWKLSQVELVDYAKQHADDKLGAGAAQVANEHFKDLASLRNGDGKQMDSDNPGSRIHNEYMREEKSFGDRLSFHDVVTLNAVMNHKDDLVGEIDKQNAQQYRKGMKNLAIGAGTELWSVPLDVVAPPFGVAGHVVGTAQMGYGAYQLLERHGAKVEKEIEARREMLNSWKFFDQQ